MDVEQKEINLTAMVLTVFAISWIGVLPSLLIAYDFEVPTALRSLELLMVLGPLLGAMIFIFRAQGLAGWKAFFRRLLYFRASLPVILVACVAPVAIAWIGAVVGHRISGTPWPDSFAPSSILVNGAAIFVAYLFLNTEELAWRGIVFDRLYDRFGFSTACLIIAPIWWLFHIPLFLYPGGHQAGYGLLPFTFIVIAQTVILGWIYVSANRSLAYPHIHHQLNNGFGQAFPLFPVFIGGNQMPLWAFVGLMLVLAGVLFLKRPSSETAVPA
jgi:membrane protease YdiL (CAAX protease family)